MAQEIAEKRGVSRRSFLKGAGVVAGAAVVGLPLVEKALAQSWLPPAAVSKETMLEMYRKMYLITSNGGKPGEVAAHVGAIMALNKGDVVTTTHGQAPQLLGQGVPLKNYLAETSGKADGIAGGRWRSYISAWDPDNGVRVPGSGLLALAIPHALGLAKVAKLRGTGQVVMTTCGDGSMNEAAFNPSINFAVIWNLPVVFHVVNNQWENHMTIHETQALTQKGLNLSTRAAGYGIPGITVDGQDVFAVYTAAKDCVDRARAGGGPSLLESVSYDVGSSRGGSPGLWPFNRPGELEYWQARDPIKRFESVVLNGKMLAQEELDSVRKAVDAETTAAKDFAAKSPAPDPQKDEYIQYMIQVFGA